MRRSMSARTHDEVHAMIDRLTDEELLKVVMEAVKRKRRACQLRRALRVRSPPRRDTKVPHMTKAEEARPRASFERLYSKLESLVTNLLDDAAQLDEVGRNIRTHICYAKSLLE